MYSIRMKVESSVGVCVCVSCVIHCHQVYVRARDTFYANDFLNVSFNCFRLSFFPSWICLRAMISHNRDVCSGPYAVLHTHQLWLILILWLSCWYARITRITAPKTFRIKCHLERLHTVYPKRWLRLCAQLILFVIRCHILHIIYGIYKCFWFWLSQI